MRQSAFRPFKRWLLFGRFLKNFPWSPLCTFSENAGLGDLAKIAITWPFRHFWSRLMHKNLLLSLHVKSILNKDNAICARVLLGVLNKRGFLGPF